MNKKWTLKRTRWCGEDCYSDGLWACPNCTGLWFDECQSGDKCKGIYKIGDGRLAIASYFNCKMCKKEYCKECLESKIN